MQEVAKGILAYWLQYISKGEQELAMGILAYWLVHISMMRKKWPRAFLLTGLFIYKYIYMCPYVMQEVAKGIPAYWLRYISVGVQELATGILAYWLG